MAKRFVHIEHKGEDYILDSPNWDLDFIEMLGDSLEPKELVGLLNHLHQENNILNKNEDDLKECTIENIKLKEENEQLRKIGVMYQGHNPCETCTYCVEDKVCCGIYPPILCDEMKKDYFVYGLCKKHKQIQKSIGRYDDE